MKKRSRSLRAIALIVVTSFIGEQLALAAPAVNPSKLDLFAKPKVDLGIPASVATIEDAWSASRESRVSSREGKPKTIYLIQDAHTNFSGQLNVAKTLDFLFNSRPETRDPRPATRDSRLKYIFLEAGSGDESLSFLRKYADLKDRQRISESFLRQAKLQGSEYFDLTSNREFVLWGVEDLPLYAKSIEAYKQVVKDREKFQTYLKKVETAVEALKPRIYNPALLSFDNEYRRYKKEELSLTDYFEVLTTQAQIHDIPLKNYPHLQKLKSLKTIETKIDFKKASLEQAQAVQSLFEADQKELFDLAEKERKPFRLSGNDHKEDKAFYTLLESVIASEAKQSKVKIASSPSAPRNDKSFYPELFKYFAYLKEAKSLNPAKLLEEQKALESEIFNSLATRPDELNLVRSSKNLEILKKLLNLTLTPDEWETYQKERQSFNIKTMTGFLNKKIMDLHTHYDRAVFLEEGYESIIQKAGEFYELTYERDKAFIENALKKMDEGLLNRRIDEPLNRSIQRLHDSTVQQSAVLITGGFHSPNLKYLLKQKNISFVNITPQVFQETNQARYEEILLGQVDKLRKSYASPNLTSAFASNFISFNTANAMRLDGLALAQSLPVAIEMKPQFDSEVPEKFLERYRNLAGSFAFVISTDPVIRRGSREISASAKTIAAARLASTREALQTLEELGTKHPTTVGALLKLPAFTEKITSLRADLASAEIPTLSTADKLNTQLENILRLNAIKNLFGEDESFYFADSSGSVRTLTKDSVPIYEPKDLLRAIDEIAEKIESDAGARLAVVTVAKGDTYAVNSVVKLRVLEVESERALVSADWSRSHDPEAGGTTGETHTVWAVNGQNLWLYDARPTDPPVATIVKIEDGKVQFEIPSAARLASATTTSADRRRSSESVGGLAGKDQERGKTERSVDGQGENGAKISDYGDDVRSKRKPASLRESQSARQSSPLRVNGRDGRGDVLTANQNTPITSQERQPDLVTNTKQSSNPWNTPSLPGLLINPQSQKDEHKIKPDTGNEQYKTKSLSGKTPQNPSDQYGIAGAQKNLPQSLALFGSERHQTEVYHPQKLLSTAAARASTKASEPAPRSSDGGRLAAEASDEKALYEPQEARFWLPGDPDKPKIQINISLTRSGVLEVRRGGGDQVIFQKDIHNVENPYLAFTIGRHPGHDISVTGDGTQYVSRQHALLIVSKKIEGDIEVTLRNLTPSNGTFVDPAATPEKGIGDTTAVLSPDKLQPNQVWPLFSSKRVTTVSEPSATEPAIKTSADPSAIFGGRGGPPSAARLASVPEMVDRVNGVLKLKTEGQHEVKSNVDPEAFDFAAGSAWKYELKRIDGKTIHSYTFSQGEFLNAPTMEAWVIHVFNQAGLNFDTVIGFDPVIEQILSEYEESNKVQADGAWLSSTEQPLRAILRHIASRMVPSDKGILAADESIGSAKNRLDMVGLENNYANRQEMRRLMLTVPGQEEAISAVILDRDTADNVDKKGHKLVQGLLDRGILPGIKTDGGLIDDPASPGEKIPNPKGLKELPELLTKFKAMGFVFTKWRTALAIDPDKGWPTGANIRKNAQVLAQSAKITQEAGLVPIVEPEVLLDGPHNIAASYAATTLTLQILFEELAKEGVWLDGVILKSSMVLSGDKASNRADSQTVGYQTLKAILKTVPSEVPAVVFLSGGQKDDEVNQNLNAISRASQTQFEAARDEAAKELEAENKLEAAVKLRQLTKLPWQMSYSFGRGLQRPGLVVWAGKEGNFDEAQRALLQAALATRDARLGRLDGARLAARGTLAGDIGALRQKGGIRVDVNEDSFKPKKVDLQIRADQEAIDVRQTDQLPALHEKLVSEVKEKTIQLIGQDNVETIEALVSKTETWRAEGDRHTLMIGSEVNPSAKAILGKLTGRTNWETEVGEGLSRVHVVDSYDQAGLLDLLATIPSAERGKVRVVVVGKLDASSKVFVDALYEAIPSTSQKTEENKDLFNARTLPLLAAGLVDDGTSDYIRKIHKGAKAKHEAWLAVTKPAEIKELPAYKIASAIARFGKSGQSLVVFWVYSTVFRLLSPWMSQRFNQAIGTSSFNTMTSGEWATQYWHSTMQAVRQAKGRNEDIEKFGFMSIVHVFLHQTKDAVTGPLASHPYRGFSFRLFLKTARAALEMTLRMAKRTFFGIDAVVDTPEELGAFLHTMEISALATGELLGNNPKKDLLPALEADIEKAIEANPTAKTIESGKIEVRQNILFVRDGKVSGVVGKKIEAELHQTDQPTLTSVLGILSLTAKRVRSKVVKLYRAGEAKDHLNPDTVRSEMLFSKAASALITDANTRQKRGLEPIRRVYSLAIGGSTFGPVMTDALGLKDGPEVVEVTSIDPEEMNKILKDIRTVGDPLSIELLVTSKSGVTTETDVAFTTIYDALINRVAEVQKISKEAAQKIVDSQVLIITDAQTGKLRDMIKARGLRSIDHPVLIGGRWSMFSTVGQIHYFMKGGKEADLTYALDQTMAWDKKLDEALTFIDTQKLSTGKSIKDALNVKKSATPEERREVLRIMQEKLSEVSGVWEGALANISNQVDSRDTEVTVGLSREYNQLVSHENPGMAQIGSESLGKPGARYYRTALFGWNALKSAWNRLHFSKRSQVTLFHSAVSAGETPSRLQNADQAAYEATLKQLETNNVPYLSVETGAMNPQNLLEVMFFEYRRLAVMASLYSPMDVSEEGQVGVEQYKKVINAFLLRVAKEVSKKAIAERIAILLRVGVEIPKVGNEEIDTISEVEMDLSKWMDQEIAEFLTDVIKGTDGNPGLVDEKTIRRLRSLPLHEIPEFISNFLANAEISQGSFYNEKVSAVYLDGGRIDVNPGTGEWVIVANALNSNENLRSHGSNGINFQVYHRVPDSETRDLKFVSDIRIALGSDERVIVSNGKATQDYRLKGKEGHKRLVEHDRAVFSEVGKTLSPGGLSSGRPEGYQLYETEIQRQLSTSYRHSDTEASDYNLILSKQGLFTGWLTWSEAVGMAKSVEGASGVAMFMSEEGVWYTADNADRLLRESRSREGGVLSRDQVYVYAGSPRSVRQIQVFMDYLIAQNAEGRPVVLDVLDTLSKISPNANFAIRAQALAWLLRLEDGIQTIPSEALNKDSELYKTIEAIKKRIPAIQSTLNLDGVLSQLASDYLAIETTEARKDRADQFILLGYKKALFRFNPNLKEGDQMKLAYDLERRFMRTPPLKLLQLLHDQAPLTELWRADITRAVTNFEKTYKHNATRRTKPEELQISKHDYRSGKAFSDYLGQEAGIPDEVRKRFNLDMNKMPKEAVAAYERIVDVYLNPQKVEEIDGDSDLQELYARRPEVFFISESGDLYVRSLHEIRSLVEDDKYHPMVNASGDVSSLLDSIFNPILIHYLRPYVSVIISEENMPVVPGYLKTNGKPKLALFLDPIDGSTQVEVGGVFGMIAALALLDEDQDLSTLESRKTFKPRKQMLGSFDMVYGFPRTILRFVNRAKVGSEGSVGPGEVAQFELLDIEGQDKVFKKSHSIPPMKRLDQDTKFKGFAAEVDPVNPKGIGFAMGGAMTEFMPERGHAELMKVLQDHFGGYYLGYTGGLVSDIGKLLGMDPERVTGIIHSYAATNSHRHGRFRYWFELLHYALMFDILGGELSNGYESMLDMAPAEPEVADEPSGAESESIFASRWMSKLAMAIRTNFTRFYEEFLKTNNNPPTQQERETWLDDFMRNYMKNSEAMIDAVTRFSQNSENDVDSKNADEIREAFFALNGNIYTHEFKDPDTGATVNLLELSDIQGASKDESDISLQRLAYQTLFSGKAFAGARLASATLPSPPTGSYVVYNSWLLPEDTIPWTVFPSVYVPEDSEDNSGAQHMWLALRDAQTRKPNLFKNARVADVGVGSGPHSGYALREGAGEVVGIDLNKAAIDNTTHNLTTYFPELVERFRGYVGNIWEALPGSQKAPFDVVMFVAPVFKMKPRDGQPEDLHEKAGSKGETIQNFIQGLPQRLTPGGTAFLGVLDAGFEGSSVTLNDVRKMMKGLPLKEAHLNVRGSFVVMEITYAAQPLQSIHAGTSAARLAAGIEDEPLNRAGYVRALENLEVSRKDIDKVLKLHRGLPFEAKIKDDLLVIQPALDKQTFRVYRIVNKTLKYINEIRLVTPRTGIQQFRSPRFGIYQGRGVLYLFILSSPSRHWDYLNVYSINAADNKINVVELPLFGSPRFGTFSVAPNSLKVNDDGTLTFKDSTGKTETLRYQSASAARLAQTNPNLNLRRPSANVPAREAGLRAAARLILNESLARPTPLQPRTAPRFGTRENVPAKTVRQIAGRTELTNLVIPTDPAKPWRSRGAEGSLARNDNVSAAPSLAAARLATVQSTKDFPQDFSSLKKSIDELLVSLHEEGFTDLTALKPLFDLALSKGESFRTGEIAEIVLGNEGERFAPALIAIYTTDEFKKNPFYSDTAFSIEFLVQSIISGHHIHGFGAQLANYITHATVSNRARLASLYQKLTELLKQETEARTKARAVTALDPKADTTRIFNPRVYDNAERLLGRLEQTPTDEKTIRLAENLFRGLELLGQLSQLLGDQDFAEATVSPSYPITVVNAAKRLIQELNEYPTSSSSVNEADRLIQAYGPSAARLSSQTQAPLSLSNLASDVIPVIFGERDIDANETITFAAGVFDATKQSGKLALDRNVLEIKESETGKLISVYLNGKLLEAGVAYREVIKEVQGKREVKISMADLKRILGKTFDLTDHSGLGMQLNSTKAVGIIDLDALNPSLNGFYEVVVPLLIREMRLAHRRSWGKEAKFLLKGDEAVVRAVQEQIDELYGTADFIATDVSQLGPGYSDAKQIVITTPDGAVQAGERHFFIQSLSEGDLPNFRAAFRAGLTLARVDKLETTDPRFMEVLGFLALFLRRDIDPVAWKQVIEGRASQNSRFFALPAITNLPLDALFAGARLAKKLLEQAA